MPTQIAFMRFSPENDPMFNEKARKVFTEYTSKREALLKKHGVKSLGGWVIAHEHLLISVLEGSLDAIQRLSMEPENVALNAYATYETKIASSAIDSDIPRAH